MAYVLNPNQETGKLEPMHVTPEEYQARCAELGIIPNKYGTRKAAQRVCEKINKAEVQGGTIIRAAQ